MNDYAKLVAQAAAKYSGRSAVLSPFLDNNGGWENKKNRFSSEPILEDFRIVLTAGGLSFKELSIEFDEHLKICMQHDSKELGENNFKWSRDCTYEYTISDSLAPFAHNFEAYWTNDDFIIVQARKLECPFSKEVNPEGLRKFRLIPTEIIDVLEPALNVPFMKQILTTIKKKSGDVCSYVNAATEVSEANDVLALLTCIPLRGDKKIEFDFEFPKLEGEKEDPKQSSQEDSEDLSPNKESSMPTNVKGRVKGSKKGV